MNELKRAREIAVELQKAHEMTPGERERRYGEATLGILHEELIQILYRMN
jgi:hypothetical protein